MPETSLNAELARLRSQGVTLPRNPHRAMEHLYSAAQTDHQLRIASESDLRGLSLKLGRPVTDANYDGPEVRRIRDENAALMRAMGDKRSLSARMQRTASVSPDVHGAIPRFYDPLEYWDLSGLPWNVADEGHRHKLHKWLRLYYATHYLIPILVDIFTRFPLAGMELECKDPKLKDFYEDLFFNQLNYEEFLVSLGREFWVVGEAFPLGSFNEDAGVWEREELINPEDIVIENVPILGSQNIKINPPDYLKRIAQTKNPPKEYRLLEANFPELIPYLLKGEHIPVSPVLMTQVGNKLNDWDDHGTPILLRGLRTLLHEEKLLASQDAIAERLYSPLLQAKLGIQDMGDGQPPWIPGPEELESVRDDLDLALSSDFRLMVHHFGLELINVFGREQMPRLGDDFDRIEKRLMHIFGISPSLLEAGSGGQPYATSALQAEFLNQMLRTFQKMLMKHFERRAMVVAEAQGHYDYEQKGRTRVQLFEEVVEYDDDFNQNIVEVPKLLIPKLKFMTLDMRDEATERQFLQGLRQIGVPISDRKLMVGMPDWDPEHEYEIFNKELKAKTITQQRAKFETYTALTIQGLPIPADLKAEVESVLMPSGMGQAGLPMGGQQPPIPGGGAGPAAGPGGIMMPNPPPGIGPQLGPGADALGGPVPGGGPPAAGPIAGPAGTVPEISNERRPGLTYNTHIGSVKDFAEADELVQNGYSPNAVGRQLRIAYIEDGANEEQAEELVGSWLEHVFAGTALVSPEEEVDSEEESATLSVETESEPETPVEEWELDKGRELRGAEDELPQRITHVKRKKDVRYKVDPSKKYSIVDPEAPPLGDKETSESDSEQARQGADV